MHADTQSESALSLQALSVRHADRWTLRDFSLRLAPGERVGLAGPSGCGKTTVLRCALGLTVPAEGEIRVHGEVMNRHTVWKLRRQLGYVAQEPDLGTGTVREVVERPFQFRANSGQRDRLSLLPAFMEQLGLSESILTQEIASLSGGEKQRIAILSVLLLARPILLLDEASSALDAASKQRVAEVMQALKEHTILSVSHDTEWLGFSDRVVTLSAKPGEAANV